MESWSQPGTLKELKEFQEASVFKISKILTGIEYLSKVSLPRQTGTQNYLLLIGEMLVITDEYLQG